VVYPGSSESYTSCARLLLIVIFPYEIVCVYLVIWFPAIMCIGVTFPFYEVMALLPYCLVI
jgi:hypothetical protein